MVLAALLFVVLLGSRKAERSERGAFSIEAVVQLQKVDCSLFSRTLGIRKALCSALGLASALEPRGSRAEVVTWAWSPSSITWRPPRVTVRRIFPTPRK